VCLAIAGLKTESAPGPNGFTVIFFKRLWQYIKRSIWDMVQHFNKDCLDLTRLNYGVLTLVPKVKEANSIRQYMPICLLNVDFKIFSRLLTERITPIADNIISPSQTTFIRGRNILEGVVVLHEVIHELKRSGKKGVLFKIDFEKAYDKVRWDFVEETLVKNGFPPIWIKQAMSTVQGGRVCVNVNGGKDPIFHNLQGS
jgi:hypothetical protein